MELERAIAVIGLAFKMPYVPADSARTAFDVLHFTMDDNAFSFSTSMMKEGALVTFSLKIYLKFFFFFIVDYRRDLAAAEAARGQSSNRVVKKGLFAPASPALSSDISPSAGTRKPSLRPPETGALFFTLVYFYFDPCTNTVPIYDGRRHQLKVPDELRNVPGILSRYPGKIPYHSLVLVAYTVSLYRAAQGSRKDQPTVPLNISFAVVLHDEPLEFKGSNGGEDGQDGDAAEEDGEEAADNQSDELLQYQSAKEAEDQSAEEVGDQSDVAAEEQSNDE